MNKLFRKKSFIIILLILMVIYYYIALPAFNIHSQFTWKFIFTVNLFVLVIMIYRNSKNYFYNIKAIRFFELKQLIKNNKPTKITFFILVILLSVYFIGSIHSSTIFNAKAYYNLMNVENGSFSEDIKEADFNTIPLMDKQSAEIIGDRVMGSMLDMVSQFEVSREYSQINIDNKPVRVSPLMYAGFIKWLSNFSDGLPAYVKIDMTTQDADVIKLEKGMKYSSFEYFNRYIKRHLRFKYPTTIFAEQLFFEIDDNGTPYYVCPVKDFKIGLFGGETVKGAVLCNAINGKCDYYKLNDIPTWVDKVFSAELLTRLYNYHGMLKEGFINSKLSQKGCLTTTNGYNYLTINDDVWVYTGVTSAASDQSIVGFVLMNQRTMQTKFYEVDGAIEDSAMASAQGQVQHLGYAATFPLLINIYGKPTYFMALKDNAGLVKKYALVSVEHYRLVAIGDNINECISNYLKIPDNKSFMNNTMDNGYESITSTVDDIKSVVIEGTPHIYFKLSDNENLFEIDLSNPSLIGAIKFGVGDTVKISYLPSIPFNIVKTIE